MPLTDDERELKPLVASMRLWAEREISKGNGLKAAPDYALNDIKRMLGLLESRTPSGPSLSLLEFMKAKVDKGGKDLTLVELKDILDRVESLAATTLGLHVPDQTERIERKIGYLERELSQLRSNPALEKKVEKIEEEVRKLRVDSVKSYEEKAKEQKDMLKEYKDAGKKVFVIMPFAPAFEDVWKGGIERACNAEGFGCLRVDKISLSSWITDDILTYLKMADFVICDITGNNPNVMFELGWALALGKKPIVVRQQDDPEKVPFDVKDIRYITYVNSWGGVETLFKEISKFIKSTSEDLNEKTARGKREKRKSKE